MGSCTKKKHEITSVQTTVCMCVCLQKPDIIADLIFREIPLLNIQATVAS